MRIGVLGGCQAAGVASGLFHLLDEDYEISSFVIGDVYKYDLLAEAERSMVECDLVFSHHLPDHVGPLSTKNLSKKIKNLILMPSVVFSGFHPDCIEFHVDGKSYKSPMMGYNSIIVTASYSMGLSVERTLPLFNKFVFKKLGYYDEFDKSRACLNQFMRNYDLDISGEWPDWVASGVFMHTINHPKSNVLASLAKLLAVKAGLVPEWTPTPGMSIDSLSALPVWPVYPEIAEALGTKASYVFKKLGLEGMAPGSDNLISLRDFIEGSHAAYDGVPAAAFDMEPIAKARTILSDLISS